VRPNSMRDNLRDSAEVAIVIPTYNCARPLPRAIESVLAQTYRDYQVFVIDDGSTDGTDVIVQQYADRITYVQQPNAGAAAARNHGISLSRSRYVAFLDADDVWLPTKLERQIELLNSQPEVGLVCSDFLMEGVVHTSQIDHPTSAFSGRYFEYLLRHCFIFTSAVVVRRQCLDEIGAFNESLKVSEDYNLWLRIASRWPVAVVPEILVHKHHSSGSLSVATSIEDRLRYGIAAFEHVLSVSTGLSDHERRILRRAIADRYHIFGSYLLLQGNQRAARPMLAKAWRCRVLNWKAAVKLLASTLPPAGLRSLMWLWRNSIGGLRANADRSSS
jgi:glycosyltransferase involved in cell wall biosynthesis